MFSNSKEFNMTTPIINKALSALRKFLLTLTLEELNAVLTGQKKIIVTETDKKIKNKKPIVEDAIEFDVIKKYPLNYCSVSASEKRSIRAPKARSFSSICS